jgi:alpha/beta superfamily hydrolase
MKQKLKLAVVFIFMIKAISAFGAVTSGVVDIPTRSDVTQRILVIAPQAPKAAVILFAGGHGGLKITPDGNFGWGQGNFLVRTRQNFADKGLLTIVVDAPSDRQSNPFLTGFRQTKNHVTDIKAIIAWVRQQENVPVWLVGTSRGTQSVGYVATELHDSDGPDGIVLTSSILTDNKMLPVTSLPLEKLTIPVLVVHHELDGCSHCSFSDISSLMKKLEHSPRKELLSFKDGQSNGDPCEALAYHGYNGIESTVVSQVANWILAK